jgi:hypothetical protein
VLFHGSYVRVFNLAAVVVHWLLKGNALPRLRPIKNLNFIAVKLRLCRSMYQRAGSRGTPKPCQILISPVNLRTTTVIIENSDTLHFTEAQIFSCAHSCRNMPNLKLALRSTKLDVPKKEWDYCHWGYPYIVVPPDFRYIPLRPNTCNQTRDYLTRFAATNLMPFSPDRVLSKLNIWLCTPTPPASWGSESSRCLTRKSLLPRLTIQRQPRDHASWYMGMMVNG